MPARRTKRYSILTLTVAPTLTLTLTLTPTPTLPLSQTHNALLNATGAENVLLLADYAAVQQVVFAPGAPNRKAYTPDGALHFKRGQVRLRVRVRGRDPIPNPNPSPIPYP